MDYISPEEFRAIWEEQFSQDCNEVDFIKGEKEIKIALLAQISYWFSVIKKTRIPEHITIQSYALYLIRQYIAVQYDIYIFNSKKANEPERLKLTYKEFVQKHYPVPSSTILGNIFMNCGDFWYIRYNDTCRLVKNYKGMEALELLLANPGNKLSLEEIHQYLYSGDIKNQVNSSSIENNYDKISHGTEDSDESAEDLSEVQLAAENSMTINAIKPPSRAKGSKISKINKRLKELQKEKSSVSPAEAIAIDREINDLYYEKLNLETHSLGEARYKKARDSQRKNMSDAKKYLQQLYPDFHEHLEKTIKQFNLYSPTEGVFWHTRFTAKQFKEAIIGK